MSSHVPSRVCAIRRICGRVSCGVVFHLFDFIGVDRFFLGRSSIFLYILFFVRVVAPALLEAFYFVIHVYFWIFSRVLLSFGDLNTDVHTVLVVVCFFRRHFR